MKKKILALAIAAIMVVTALASISLAYLMDSDYDKNTMTVGNVKIEQIEQRRVINDDGSIDGTALETYANDQKLLPAVYPNGKGTLAYDNTITLDNGNTQKIWDETVNNEIDKIVTVTNTGTESAFIRTIFAFEDKELDGGQFITNKIHTLWNASDAVEANAVVWPKDDNGKNIWITVDGVNYTICVYTYKAPVAAGATTNPSLVQLFLDPTADNSFMEHIGAQYDILVLSQAVQSAGFETLGAEIALNEAFGEVSVANAAEVEKWFVNATN